VIAQGEDVLDSLYLRRLAPPSAWRQDRVGSLTMALGVEFVPAWLVTEAGEVVDADASGAVDWGRLMHLLEQGR
jgi:hypothetical protein